MNWKDFKSEIDDFTSDNPGWFYRGQTDPMWSLKTTYHRIVESVRPDFLTYLSSIVPEVHYLSEASLGEAIDLQDQGEYAAFLTLIQHHGFPTPILDWTYSPYVAAFFAFRDVKPFEKNEYEVKIFAFNSQQWQALYPKANNLNHQAPFIDVFQTHPRRNRRVIPQRGVYTVTNIIDMDQHIKIQNKQHPDVEFLREFKISAKDRNLAMRDIDLMGINAATLFPDLDGVCATIKERFNLWP